MHSAVTRNELEKNLQSAQTLATDIKDKLRSRAAASSSATTVLRQRLEEAWNRVKQLQVAMDERDATVRTLKEEKRKLQLLVQAADAQLQRQQAEHHLDKLAGRSRETERRMEKVQLEAQVALLESSFASARSQTAEDVSSAAADVSVMASPDVQALQQQLDEVRRTAAACNDAHEAELAQLRAQLANKTQECIGELRKVNGATNEV